MIMAKMIPDWQCVIISMAVCLFSSVSGRTYTMEQPSVTEKASDFAFASYYNSHMILQRAPQRAGLWGYAATTDIGKIVTISVTDPAKTIVKYQTPVQTGPFSSRAVWRLLLRAEERRGPFIITAELAGRTPLTLIDVLYGDVWLCSGQSNMQFTVTQMFGHEYELAEARNYSDIRLFNINRVTSQKPLYDLKSILLPWTAPSGAAFAKDWTGFSAVCYMFGKHLYEHLRYPLGLIDTTWGGTPVECWSSPEALATCGLHQTQMSSADYRLLQEDEYVRQTGSSQPSQYSVLWNAMIHPLLNMTVKGAIWYQGEANTKLNLNLYNCTFPAMIKSWRQNFNQVTHGQVPTDMPFGFVQIGPNAGASQEAEFGYPTVRWHQMGDNVQGLPLPNTFMAVAMDLTDPVSPYGQVHIRDKRTVARRLAWSARNIIYHQGSALDNFPYPTHEQVDPKNKQLIVEFLEGKRAINVWSFSGFEVCCASEYSQCPLNSTDNWVQSPIVKFSTTAVWLSWKQCTGSEVAAYRYAWRETPCSYHQCAIYSDYSGDPLPTFTKPLRK